MTGDHHGRTAARATLSVRAANDILGTHKLGRGHHGGRLGRGHHQKGLPYRRKVGNVGRARKAKKQPRREPLHPSGLGRRRRGTYDCGLCGVSGPLTKTHVPPQSAGNNDDVLRYYYVTQGQGMRATRSKSYRGGIQSDMLCNDCNNLQSRYDPAYATFAKSLLPWWTRSSLQLTGMEPASRCEEAGAVARSIHISMFGLNPRLKARHPDIVRALISESPILNMPPDARLHLALARGFKAQVTGYRQIHTFVAYRPLMVESLAQVYFPPLAWILADREKSLLDFRGWVDVSSWLALPASTTTASCDL
jgi:hypothetical protein